MSSRRHFALALLVALSLLLLLTAIGCSGAEESTTPETGGGSSAEESAGAVTDDADDPARALVETKCSMCHSLDRVWSASKSGEQWVATVDRMKANGLVLTDDEYEQIVGFLSAQ